MYLMSLCVCVCAVPPVRFMDVGMGFIHLAAGGRTHVYLVVEHILAVCRSVVLCTCWAQTRARDPRARLVKVNLVRK